MAGGGKIQMDNENRLVYKAFYQLKLCWDFQVIFWWHNNSPGCVSG